MAIPEHSDFYSIHQVPILYTYTLDGGGTANVSRVGFKNQFNYDDTVIRCGTESTVCAYQTLFSFRNITLNDNFGLFRVYVPTGTGSTSLSVSLTSTDTCFVVAKMETPPSADYSTYFDNFTQSDIDLLPNSGFSLDQLMEYECIGTNLSGIINIIKPGRITNSYLINGSWVYILLFSATNNFSQVSFKVSNVNSVKYISWFNSVSWDVSDDPDAASSSTVVTLTDSDFKEIYPLGFNNTYPIPNQDSNTIYSTTIQNFSVNTQHIKVFVPPGCTYISLHGLTTVGYSCLFAERFNSPLSRLYTQYALNLSLAQFNALANDNTSESLTDILNTDLVRTNGKKNSTPNIVDFNTDPLNHDIQNIGSKGGWIYLSMYPISGTYPGIALQYNFHVGRYSEWYNSILWDVITGSPILDSEKVPVTGTIVVDPDPVTFVQTAFNSTVTQDITLTSSYTSSVSVTLSSAFTEISFSDTTTTLVSNTPKIITITYNAKTQGKFSNYIDIVVNGSSSIFREIVYCECTPPDEACLLTTNIDTIIFPVTSPNADEDVTGTVTVESTYDTQCTILVSTVPTQVSVDPASQTIDNTASKDFTFNFGYTVNTAIDTLVYITSTEHEQVAVPIRLIGVCTDIQEDLVVIQSSINFGIVKLGQKQKRYLTLCSRYSGYTDVTITSTSPYIKLSSIKQTLGYNVITSIDVTYIPTVDNTVLTNQTIDIEYLNKVINISLIGSCPTYVPDLIPSFSMIDAPDFRMAELNNTYTGLFAILNNTTTSTMASIVYPEGFTGPEGPMEINYEAPVELEVSFTPTEEKQYIGDIKIKEWI